MAKHEPCGDDIFIGNTEIAEADSRIEWFAQRGVTVRRGETAYDIDGNPLPTHSPLFVARSEQDRHHRVMMIHTFGEASVR